MGRHGVPVKKLSELDGVLRYHLLLACERYGSQAQFASVYDLSEAEVSRMMKARIPVGGRTLRALYAELMQVGPDALSPRRGRLT
jgi:DNA-binding transcriptional regulator YdaS (Cro superfamily)